MEEGIKLKMKVKIKCPDSLLQQPSSWIRRCSPPEADLSTGPAHLLRGYMLLGMFLDSA